MAFLRNNDPSGIWIGQNVSDQTLSNITNVTGHLVDGTVTLTVDAYSSPVSAVTYAGRVYTGIVEVDPTTITATVPHNGLMGIVDNITITDAEGTSAGFPLVLSPATGYSFTEFSVDEANVPSQSVFFGSGAGFVAGDQFTHPTLSDNTSETLALDSEGVPTSFLTATTHNYLTTWFVDSADGSATASATLSVVVANNTVSAFTFLDVTGATVDQTYQDSQPITGPDVGSLLYVTDGELSNDGGLSYSVLPIPYIVGQTHVRATLVASSTGGVEVTVTPDVNGTSDTFSVTTAGGGPDPLVFTDLTDQPLSTQVTSNMATQTGAGGSYTVTNGVAKIDGGLGAPTGTVNLGESVELVSTTSASPNDPKVISIDVDGVVSTWTITTGSVSTPIFINNLSIQGII